MCISVSASVCLTLCMSVCGRACVLTYIYLCLYLHYCVTMCVCSADSYMKLWFCSHIYIRDTYILMHIYMYVCVQVCIYVSVYLCTSIFQSKTIIKYIWTCLFTYICLCVCVPACILSLLMLFLHLLQPKRHMESLRTLNIAFILCERHVYLLEDTYIHVHIHTLLAHAQTYIHTRTARNIFTFTTVSLKTFPHLYKLSLLVWCERKVTLYIRFPLLSIYIYLYLYSHVIVILILACHVIVHP